MRKTIHVLLLALLCHYAAHSQLITSPAYKQYYLVINDARYAPLSVTPVMGGVSVSFRYAPLNSIASSYTFLSFGKAFPASRFPDMQRVYSVVVSSGSFITQLRNSYPVQYPAGWAVAESQSTYTPNDYNVSRPPYFYNYDPNPLNLINAQLAWDYPYSRGIMKTTGQPVVIGVADESVTTNQFIIHEDLKGKFRTVRNNSTAGNTNPWHGTLVCGLLAARTDNDTGLSSIGFNSQLDFSTDPNSHDNTLLQMSKDGDRVLNGSFIQPDYSSPSIYNPNLGSTSVAQNAQQRIFDEIYENGTLACFGAGNGTVHSSLTPSNYYEYPASYHHNISVTGVGCDQSTNGSAIYPADVFKFPGNTKTYVYNNRVDMSAPGYNIRALDTCSSGTTHNRYKTLLIGGTSSAVTFVTGTAALMVGSKPCLSPYQMECILKNSGVSIDGIAINAPYAGKIGKRLNAGAALQMSSGYDCNTPSTQTMYIEGVDFNTLCSPNSISFTGPKPILRPRVRNSSGTLTCQWVPLLDSNHSTLDDPNIETPRILPGSSRARYKLTVIDQSPIPKVATKIIDIKLITDSTKWDLAVRDAYVDMLDEPNSMAVTDPRDWQLWQSPDIWNRQNKDGVIQHENPEYFNTASNYLYTRVRNVGCVASPNTRANLKLYWTLGSTGENWRRDWLNGNGANPAVGGEITPTGGLSIPVIQPGDSTIMVQGWRPPEPQAYAPNAKETEVCVLARIETASGSPYGMTFREAIDSNVKWAVSNNNNIATLNMVVNNYNTANRGSTHRIYFGNADRTTKAFTLQVLTDKDIHKHFAGNLSEYMYAAVHLDRDLFRKWSAGGRKGQYGEVDEDNSTIMYDPATPMRLDNIKLDANERYPITIDFVVKQNVAVPFDVANQQIHFRQLTMVTPVVSSDESSDASDAQLAEEGENTAYEDVYGDVSFIFNLAAMEASGGKGNKAGPNVIASNKDYSIFPNPANNALNILRAKGSSPANVTITDVTGKVIMTKKTTIGNSPYAINTSILSSGIYFVKVTGSDGAETLEKVVIRH